jgi:adenine/guanine/hypoxanthine permease
MSMTATATGRERYWVPGDWNAFFGFGTNILVNVLVLTGLLRFVLKMPDSLVFGRILPATGLMLFLSTVYYAWLAYRLAQKTGRTDICALPSGISVPPTCSSSPAIFGRRRRSNRNRPVAALCPGSWAS